MTYARETRYPALNTKQKEMEAHKSILGDIDKLVVGTHDLGNLHRTMSDNVRIPGIS